MTEDTFWSILDLLDWSREGDDDKVLSPVIRHLAGLSDEDIFAFDDWMSQLLYDIDSEALARAVYGPAATFSGDDFLYTRCVALVNGRAFYEAVRGGRETPDPGLEFEAILTVPERAWARKHRRPAERYPHAATPSRESGSNAALWRRRGGN